MELTIRPDGILQIDNAWITYRNFSGVGDQFNREGDRHFTLVIEDEAIAEALVAEGWNVRIKPARVEGESPRWHLKVKVKFTEYGPHAYLWSGNRRNKLDEDSVHRLDKVRISKANMDIRPYDWTMGSGKSGRTAYLQSMHVVQRIDRFAARYSSLSDDDKLPI